MKPDRPATPLDAMFLPHQRPYLTRTFSENALGRWQYLAAYHLERGDESRRGLDDFYAAFAYSGIALERMFVLPEHIERWDVDLAQDLGIDRPVVVYDWQSGEAQVAEESLALRPTTEAFRARYLVLAPILDNELALIGERSKFVTLADRRFTQVGIDGEAILLALSGAPGEELTLLAYDAREQRMLPEVSVRLDAAGLAQVSIHR